LCTVHVLGFFPFPLKHVISLTDPPPPLPPPSFFSPPLVAESKITVVKVVLCYVSAMLNPPPPFPPDSWFPPVFPFFPLFSRAGCEAGTGHNERASPFLFFFPLILIQSYILPPFFPLSKNVMGKCGCWYLSFSNPPPPLFPFLPSFSFVSPRLIGGDKGRGKPLASSPFFKHKSPFLAIRL